MPSAEKAHIDEKRVESRDDTSDVEDENEPLLNKSEDSSREGSPEQEDTEEPEEDPRFNQPPPAIWKRLALIGFVGFLFWLGLVLRGNLLQAKKKPQIIYASRYSKEHKFRPAASPIITETLKDGRIRLRGAVPTPTPEAEPIAGKKKRKSTKRKAGSKKRKSKAGAGKRR
ncbi:hypothetical protein CVT24_012495 [Panaeolus cyanescens]|uniref:Uncharacterized protein n=1 Tax=Panaeolus cyanescens TaxID=181874 RepID=A0A409YK16_9AGAR|nr:hypothetical protein CVT24_012495 [Panaeolus cyanescens]